MTTSAKNRQRKYKQRLADRGKRTITAHISEEAYDILVGERNASGESFSEIVERAVLSLETILLPVIGDFGAVFGEYRDLDEYVREGYRRIAAAGGTDPVELMECVLRAAILGHELIKADPELARKIAGDGG